MRAGTLLRCVAVAALVAAASASIGIDHQALKDFAAQQDPSLPNVTLAMEWTSVEFDFSGSSWGSREAAIEQGAYIPDNNIATGLAYYNGTMFACVPRWKPGVPSTLNVAVPLGNGSYVFQPWPSWQANEELFGYVQAVWVDSDAGELYVIDAGRQNFFGGDPAIIVNTSAKLYVYDIKTNVGEQIYFHEFSDDILPYNNSFLNDIIVDTKRRIAYMSDTNIDPLNGAVIALNLNTHYAVRFVHESTMANQSYTTVVNNKSYPIGNPCDGIALSSDGLHVYYSVIRGDGLWTLDAMELTNPAASWNDIASTVRQLGPKPGGTFSDGMHIVPRAGALGSTYDTIYFGGIRTSSLLYGNMEGDQVTSEPFITDFGSVVQSDYAIDWVDSFASVPNPTRSDGLCPLLLFSTNRLQDWFFGTMNFNGKNGPNMRFFWTRTC